MYLLRCDDVDTYKSSARKLLREWFKAHTPPSQGSNVPSSSQDNHDAFEWIIVHVVLPDVQNSSIWPSKVSSSVLDKIRSDFNGSSKTSVDRVAQIPATKDLQVQGITVSGIPAGPARESFLAGSARAWDDLVFKLKSLILTSFDLRVRQYEEDIKEKGSQRNLPGWNFCTFFVLKEGLARGFESVGLVEDALMGYDELSAELISALRDQVSKAAAGENATLFREHTQELLIQAESALEGVKITPKRHNAKRLSSSILDTDKKPFRELILANNISAFDFRSYVFARQVSILMRITSLSAQSSAQPTPPSTDGTGQESLDPAVLIEVCRRAISFIASIGRTIRKDLKASFKAENGADKSALRARYNVIENIVCSWTFTSALQILARAENPMLSKQVESMPQDLLGPLPSLRPSSTASQNSVGSDGSSAKGPSLAQRGPSITSPLAREVHVEDQENGKSTPKFSSNTFTLQLAAQRGELYLIARRALNSIGNRAGWKTGWFDQADDVSTEDLDDVSLADGEDEENESKIKKDDLTEKNLSHGAGVLDESLKADLSSVRGFYTRYEVSKLLYLYLRLSQLKIRNSHYPLSSTSGSPTIKSLLNLSLRTSQFFGGKNSYPLPCEGNMAYNKLAVSKITRLQRPTFIN